MATKTPHGTGAISLLAGLAGLMRKYRIYPPGHPTLDQALEDFLERLNAFFAFNDELTFGVGRERLYLNDHEIRADEGLAAMCQMLHANCISSMTITNGLDANQIENALSTLMVEPIDAQAQGGYNKLMDNWGVKDIRVTQIDYSVDKMGKSDSTADLSASGIWKKLAGPPPTQNTQKDVARGEFIQRLFMDSERLASVLDAGIASAHDQLAAEKTTELFFRNVLFVAGRAKKEGKQPLALFTKTVRQALHLVNPKTRYMLFQKAVMDAEPATTAVLMHIFTGLSDRDMAVGLLEGLNTHSATLYDFSATYQKFVTPEKEPAILNQVPGIVNDTFQWDGDKQQLLKKQIDLLPKDRPAVGKLVKKIKQALTERTKSSRSIYGFLEDATANLAEIRNCCSEKEVETQAFENLFEVLDTMRPTTNYEIYAFGLDEEISGLINAGRYELAEKAVRILVDHASEKNPHQSSRQVAQLLLEGIKTADVAEDLLAALSAWGKNKSASIGLLLETMGDVVYEPAFVALAAEHNRAVRSVLVDILARGGEETLKHCPDYLKSNKWFVVRNIISLLEQIRPENLSALLADTVEHADARVRKEAARALASTKDDQALNLLTRLSGDSDSTVALQAILGIGQFRDSEKAAQFLAEKVDGKSSISNDAKAFQLAIEALGRIRSTAALTALSNIVLGKNSAAKHNSDALNSAVKALCAIGDPSAKQILEKGSKSWNRTIRKACRESIGA